MWSTDYELPDDGLCKLKHVGASVVILKVFNSLTFFKQFVCALVGQINDLVLYNTWYRSLIVLKILLST